MARDWIRLPSYSSREEAERHTSEGWQVFQIEQLYEQLPVGKRFEQKTSLPIGKVPVIDQSAAGFVGWHNEAPGVLASPENPVVTFANHTCEMRLMEEPFSVIQNVFPLIGRSGVCRTRFLYYLTKGRIWLEEYKGHFPEFRRKWVCCPPDKEQDRLVKVFGDLDNKIELNHRINQTLEAMAQAIFKSWFVDFDPVKAKIAALQEGLDPLRAAMSAISGKPDAELDALPPEQYDPLAATAALFPDEMEESELGEIPRGWIYPGIETLANVKQGKYLGKDEMQDAASAAFPFPVWGGNGILGYSQKFAYSSPVVLMTCRGSNCGLIKHTESAAWVSNNSFACIPKIGSTLFLLTYFQAELFDDCVSGSAQPQITYTSLKTKKLKFPVEPNVCAQFSKLMDSAFSAILSLNKQTSELSALRDTLLPKLLSGDLSVADVTSEVNA